MSNISRRIDIPFTLVRSGAATSSGAALELSDGEAIISAIEQKHDITYNADKMHLFRISDETVDSWGTVFQIGGWDLSRRSARPFVTYQHPMADDSDHTVIIGTGYEVIHGEALYSLFVPDLAQRDDGQYYNDVAVAVHHKIKTRQLTDASIWAEVIDGKPGYEIEGADDEVYYFTETRLISYGIVMMGANVTATLQQLRAVSTTFTNSNNTKLHRQTAKRGLIKLKSIK